MRPNSVASGTAFISALLSLIVFIVALCAVGYSVYQLTQTSMISLLEAQVTEELVLFEQIVQRDGQQGLIDAISRLSAHPGPATSVVGIYDLSGNLMAGTVGIAPNFVGWHNTTLLLGNLLESQDYQAGVRRLSTSIVVVGRNTELIQASLDTLALSLQVAGVFVVILTTLIGYIASRQVRTRLQKMTDALLSVSKGQLDTRLPVKNDNSQLDHASREINRHLDTLQRLMTTTDNTIQAIAHDLRSPLSRASMHLQTMQQDKSLTDAQTTCLGQAQTHLEEINQVFDTILRIAKLSRTQGSDQFEPILLTSLLSDLEDLFQPIVEEHEQTLIVVNSSKETNFLFGDLRMLRQMMINLIENAIRHAGSSAIISVAATGNFGSIELRVCDNGPGIPANLHAQVLEPFYKQDQSRTSLGTGLGLSLVAAIAKRHGADISLSDNNPGLCVSISFPESTRH